jgi:hypothetical protein
MVRRRLKPGSTNHTVWWLVVLAILVEAVVFAFPAETPLIVIVLPMLLGSLLLGPRQLPWFVLLTLVLTLCSLAVQPSITPRVLYGVGVLFAAGLIILITSYRRLRLGVGGAQGESMLIDLRDRIQSQGAIPPLPPSFAAESALRSAGGTPFAGDFVVACLPTGSNRLEVAVVDVSGKGEGAGTRALLLSGAFGGLLGAVPPEEFLVAANDYVLRQHWDEGFATAVHLSLDLLTGDYEVRTAGHPPAAHRQSGSGRWVVCATEGTALGFVEDVEFSPAHGRLRSGDALLLYTDGIVETRTKDIGLGIDRMLGRADSLLRGQYDGGAARLVEALGSRDDDRALLLVHRR